MAHAALPYLVVLCGLAILGFALFNVINGDVISLIDSDDDEENQQLNQDIARAKRESLLPDFLPDSKGSSGTGLMDNFDVNFDDDDKKPASDGGGKKPAAKKETETIDLLDSDSDEDDIEAPRAPNQPAPKKQRRGKKDKDEKMKPSEAKAKAKKFNTPQGKPLSEPEAKLKAQECLDTSRQDNVTSSGSNIRPGYSENDGITQILPSNWSAVTNSPESEAFGKKLFRDKDLLAYNIQLQLPTFLSCDALYLSLMTMFFMGSLIVVFFLRGCGSSGINAARCISVLMKNPDFRILIEVLQSTFGEFGRFWIAANVSGKQTKHPDHLGKVVGEKCTHRGLLTFLSKDKVMWFECQRTGATFGLVVPHGALLILSKRGGGADGRILHSVVGGEHSWLLAFDFSYKNMRRRRRA